MQVRIQLEGELVNEIRVLRFLGFILCCTLTCTYKSPTQQLRLNWNSRHIRTSCEMILCRSLAYINIQKICRLFHAMARSTAQPSKHKVCTNAGPMLPPPPPACDTGTTPTQHRPHIHARDSAGLMVGKRRKQRFNP